MPSSDRKVKFAYLIAAAGLALSIVSLILKQPLGAIFGGVVTLIFVVCVFFMERSRKP